MQEILEQMNLWELTIDSKATNRFFDLQFFAGDDADKTEEATPKRKEEARKKGQVPKSTELHTVAVLLLVLCFMNLAGEWLFGIIYRYMQNCFSPSHMNVEVTESNLFSIMFFHLQTYLLFFLPIGFIAMFAGVAINYAQVGFLFTLEPLKPKFDKINPISGLKRIFSPRSIVELVKALVKLLIVGYFAYDTIKNRMGIFLTALNQGPLKMAGNVWSILFAAAIKICSFLLLLAVLDYVYQRWEYKKSIRMTKKEVKDEYKMQEGNPQIKAKIRQRQRQMAMRRMMQEVPKADVVITNPTHYAVALSYNASKMAAPIVVAKGENFIAAKIKEIARENDVAMVENKPLAQALYRTVDIGAMIPAELFKAVAEVLAFVYRLRQEKAAR